MGGERFDTPQPEAYLFGENADLNFLGSRPTPVRLIFFFLLLYCKRLIEGIFKMVLKSTLMCQD